MRKKFFAALIFAVMLGTLFAGCASGASVTNADIVFFIDSSGSMDDDIQGVRTNLAAFSAAMVSSGINVRFAMIEYVTSKGVVVHKPDGTNTWTSDVSQVEAVLAAIYATSYDSNSLIALNEIFKWGDFRNDAQRFGFMLTDTVKKSSYNSDSEYVTEESTIQKLLEMNMHMSVITNKYHENSYYDIYTQTGGEFIDIDEGDYYQKMLGIANYVDSIVQSIDAQPDVPINTVSFPDENFMNYLKDNFDENGDGILSGMERSVASLNLKGKGISNLTGIELFYLLTYLDCSYNNLTTLDVSKNTRLRTLYCNNNHLTALDLSKNTSLTKVDARNQFARTSEAAFSGNASLPYQFGLNLINSSLGASVDIDEFMSRVYSVDVVNQAGGSVNFSVDTAGRRWYFAEKDVLVTYSYKTTSSDRSEEASGSHAVTADASLMTTRPAIYEKLLSEDYSSLLNSIRNRLSVSSDTPLIDNTTLSLGTALSEAEAFTALRANFSTQKDLSVDIIFPSVRSNADGIAVFSLSSDQIAHYRGKRASFVMINKNHTSVLNYNKKMGVILDEDGHIASHYYSNSYLPTTGDLYVAAFMEAGAEYDPIIEEGVLDAPYVGTPYADTATEEKDQDLGVKLALGNVVVPPTVELSPSSQTTQTESTITPISLIVLNTLTSEYTAAVRELPAGLTFANNKVTGSISSVGTYTISVDVTDSVSLASATASAAITIVDHTPTLYPTDPSSPSTPTVPQNYQPDTYQDTPVIMPEPQGEPAVSEDIPSETSSDIPPVSGDTPAPTSGDSPVNPTPGGNIDPYDNNDGSSWNNAVSFSTAEALIDMLGRVNRGVEPQGLYYKITSNIDLSSVANWEGIGTDEHPFTGHLDGGGNTITYVNSSTALFGTVNSEGTAIQNLRVVARSANASASFSSSAAPSDTNGGIVRKLVGGTIEDCSFSGNVSAGGDDSSAGGIAGEVSGGTIKNCEVQQGSGVNAGYSAGGIAGYISGGEITDCTSNAEINAEYSGGIAGFSETDRSNIHRNSFTESDYEVGNDASSLILTPASQNVQEGSAITAITFNAEGIRSWSFTSDLSGLTSRDNSISGTIPYNTPAGVHTITINAVNSDGTRRAGQATVNVTRRSVNGGRNFMGYTFDVPAALRSGVTRSFGVDNVYQLTEGEIISETWQPGRADLQEIAGKNMRVVLTLPEVRPSRSGVYMLKLTLLDVSAGSVLGIHGITGSSQVSSSALENMEYAFFDETGREIKEVPPGKVVYAALRLSSGRTHRGVVTAPKELELGSISPIEINDTLRNKIAETMEISADKLMSISEDNISAPQEPTQAMLDEMSKRDSYVVGKMNTLLVSRDGYYVFKVTLSDDLYDDHIKGVNADELRVYVLHDNGDAGSSEVSASFILGLLNTWELLTMKGEKLQAGAKEFLMVCSLNSGTPFSVYLAKLIAAMVMMGGCDAGLGLAGLGVLAGAVILILRRRR